MAVFVGDFETTTNPDDCRVWAYAICDVKNPDDIIIGTTIDDFFDWCEKRKENDTIYFHNLKFDAQSIISYLFLKGYDHTVDPKERKSRTFNTSINYKNLYYKVEVIFKKHNKRTNKVIFQDSLKLVPLSVKAIAESFQLPFSKLKIAYDAHNNLPLGAPLSEKEIEYVKNDVKIVAHAIDYFHSQGLMGMTIGQCAMTDFKTILSGETDKKKQDHVFRRFFPEPQYHDNIKPSYRGGFTYLYPKFAKKTVGKGLVFDVNSLYPSVMVDNYLPFGEPRFKEGKYEYDPIYPLYIQEIRCQFDLKPGKIPTIQIKEHGRKYLTSSNGIEEVLILTNVDLELFFEHYDVKCLEYLSHWKFKASKGIFSDYIKKWSDAKIAAKKRGDWGMYLIAKLFLNSLYGKFGSANREKSKIPAMGKDGVVYYYDSELKEKKPIYLPMASFITSYARKKAISSFQHILDNYNNGISKAQPVYCDTDSLHIYLNGEDEETFIKTCGLDIDDTKLGAWKREYSFTKGKFLRAKCYMEKMVIPEKVYLEGIQEEQEELEADREFISEKEYKKRKKESLFSKDEENFYQLNITVAGMPSACYPQVSFNNFKIGQRYNGRKTPTIVRGGVILKDIDFTIKEG